MRPRIHGRLQGGWRGVLAAALLPGLGACALQEQMQQLGRDFRSGQGHVEALHQQFADATGNPAARQAARQVERPWVVGRAQPLAREVALPAALRANVNTTLLFADGPADLPTLAQRITLATGIPVHVRPEALLPAGMFLPRLSTAAGASVPTAASQAIDMSTSAQPLSRLLDRASARWGVYWRYDNQRLEFYRTETRVFSVRALTLNATAEASLGLAGAGASGEGFISTSRTRLQSPEHDVMQVIRARIEPFLSQAGVLVAEPGASASVVVTDTPDALARIGRYLDHENRGLTRRVRLLFEEVTLLGSDTAEAGIDWNLVFSSARVAASLASPAGVAAEAGSLGIGIQQGPFQGSEAIVKALGKVGRVLRRSSLPVLTLNRRPVTHAVRTTFSYIDRIEATSLGAVAGTALPTVSVSQKEETVGSLVTLVPDAQENGQILLSIAYDNTVAQPLKSVTFGDKANPLQLQQITIDGNGTVQQVVLQPGQPLLISGFDRTEQETAGRRLNPGVPLVLGGSDRAASQSLTTVMIVTAQVEEGF